MTCNQCGISITRGKFCSYKCRGDYQQGVRKWENIAAFEKLIAEGVGFNQACRMAGISKYTGWWVKKGYHLKGVRHNQYGKIGKEGYFNVHEMEWL